ncbi:hypothetical protein B0H13DRAFT_2323197 [Mycena leptocephala]|nr:hypothetical protein B0H13DRAFT_2323197 [Mycena leptocephala]
MVRTVRSHTRADARKQLHLALGSTSADNGSNSHSDDPFPPDPSVQHDHDSRRSQPHADEDEEDDYFTFDPDSGPSEGENCTTSDYLWPASDSDFGSQTAFGFSSDSEDDRDVEHASVNPPDDSSDEEGQEDGPTENSSASDFYVEEIATDPLFCSRSSLFDAFQPDQERQGEDAVVPWAFDDHPAIRNAYIRAFVGAAFEGMTRSAAALMLEGARVLLLSQSRQRG